jgi:hypothetical protein
MVLDDVLFTLGLHILSKSAKNPSCKGESFACDFLPKWGLGGEMGFWVSYAIAEQFVAYIHAWIERFFNKLFGLV